MSFPTEVTQSKTRHEPSLKDGWMLDRALKAGVDLWLVCASPGPSLVWFAIEVHERYRMPAHVKILCVMRILDTDSRIPSLAFCENLDVHIPAENVAVMGVHCETATCRSPYRAVPTALCLDHLFA